MDRRIWGRVGALLLGAVMGITATLFVIPLHLDGEWLLVNRVGYSGGEEPARGDRIIMNNIVFTEDGAGGRVARRVAAVEGDRVEIKDGRLRINGEDFMDLWPEMTEFSEDMTTEIVGEDRVFVLCETGAVGLDSRSEAVGQVHRDDIWGRVLYARKEN